MPSPERRDLRVWIAPVILVLLLVAGMGAIVVLSRRANTTEAPAPAAAFVLPAPARPITALNVSEVSGSTIKLSNADKSSGIGRDLPASEAIRWEVLQRIAPADVKVGDWVTIIGIPNAVRSFSIRSVVVFPAGSKPGEEGIVRSEGQFAGHEAAQDPLEKPVFGGTVMSLGSRDGTTEVARGLRPATYTVVTVQGPAGTFTLDLQNETTFALSRLVAGQASDVKDGDRVAFVPTDGVPAAVLVLPGGAQ